MLHIPYCSFSPCLTFSVMNTFQCCLDCIHFEVRHRKAIDALMANANQARQSQRRQETFSFFLCVFSVPSGWTASLCSRPELIHSETAAVKCMDLSNIIVGVCWSLSKIKEVPSLSSLCLHHTHAVTLGAGASWYDELRRGRKHAPAGLDDEPLAVLLDLYEF